MAHAGVTNLLPVDMRNKNIFRFIQFDHLAEWFESGQYVLINPSEWEDPFEKHLASKIFPDDVDLNYQKGCMYGLCFSRNGISDALWRIYSTNQFGIRIRTTPDLFSNMISCSNPLAAGRTYIGNVEYCSTAALKAKTLDIKSRLSRELQTELVARTMLLKRQSFSHEQEVRILHLTHDKGQKTNYIKFDIDPHTAIKSLLIDPRAPESRVKAFTRYFKEVCKFKGRISQSELYAPPNF